MRPLRRLITAILMALAFYAGMKFQRYLTGLRQTERPVVSNPANLFVADGNGQTETLGWQIV